MRDAWLVMTKDLRLERRSKIGIVQVLPFAVLVLLIFAFALDPDRGVLERATPGLFWVAVLFSSILTLQRSFGVEAEDGVLDALRLSGMAPAGIFLGKVAALVLQLLVLEAVLAVGVIVFYSTELHGIGLLAAITVAATVGIAASGAIYGALSARLRSRDTLLPLLMLPLLAPVLISATRGFEVGLERQAGGGWSWAALLGVFALVYLTLGALLFRPLLEDA
ncbi:MAG: heme exporter protein CcmB [Microthrixaceae bacterium]